MTDTGKSGVSMLEIGVGTPTSGGASPSPDVTTYPGGMPTSGTLAEGT